MWLIRNPSLKVLLTNRQVICTRLLFTHKLCPADANPNFKREKFKFGIKVPFKDNITISTRYFFNTLDSINYSALKSYYDIIMIM